LGNSEGSGLLEIHARLNSTSTDIMCPLTKVTSYRLDDLGLKPSEDKNSPPQHKTHTVSTTYSVSYPKYIRSFSAQQWLK